MSSLRFDAARLGEYRSQRRTTDDNGLHPKDDNSMARSRRTDALPPPPPDVLKKRLGLNAITIEWLAGDGSDRCYYRLRSPDLQDGTLVLMQLSGSDAQALKEDGYDWIKIAALLTKTGVFVPQVIAALPDHAALVIEDYGDIMLENRVFELADKGDEGQIRQLYRKATQAAVGFLKIEPSPDATWCKRGFDRERLVWEFNFFLQKYATSVAKLTFTAQEAKALAKDSESLAQDLAETARFFVHRDFHSRNIMVRDDKLAVIDFQDARLGPPSYDLVSLCFDSYVPFGATFRRELLETGIAQIHTEVGAATADLVRAQWRPMLLQRQLKAIGSFGFLTVDKQRGDYLKYVDPALRTIEEQDTFDSRWPFVSGELIKRLRGAVAEGTSS